MNESDLLWDELSKIYSRWGIEEIPFSQNASSLGESRLREVFTGRREELKKVLHLFYGSERQRLNRLGIYVLLKAAELNAEVNNIQADFLP